MSGPAPINHCCVAQRTPMEVCAARIASTGQQEKLPLTDEQKQGRTSEGSFLLLLVITHSRRHSEVFRVLTFSGASWKFLGNPFESVLRALCFCTRLRRFLMPLLFGHPDSAFRCYNGVGFRNQSVISERLWLGWIFTSWIPLEGFIHSC